MNANFKLTEETLQMTAIMIRHGDRAPHAFHPDDPNKAIWPNGEGQQTALGKQQAFELGQQLRKRYEGFFNPNYYYEDVYVRSTDYNRCLATASSCMAGLFPSQGTDVWSASNPWQPVPIHTAPGDTDPCFLSLTKLCEPASAHFEPAMYQHFQTHKDIYDRFKKSTGYSPDEGIPRLMASLESVYFEKLSGLPTPHDSGVHADELLVIFMELVKITSTKSPTILKSTAATFDACLHAMKDKIEGKTPRLKSYFFFTHDIVIGSGLFALTGEFERPGYVGMLIFELHKQPEKEEYYIKVIFKKGLPDEEREIQLVGIQSPCTFKDFETVVGSFIQLH